MENEETTPIDLKPDNNEKKNKKGLTICIIILVIILIVGGITLLLSKKDKKEDKKEKDVDINIAKSQYTIKSNRLEDFDLYFLQLENEEKNTIYSPLSIKYALLMLESGTNGLSKAQISNIVGDYNPKKYNNSNNMSFANGLFIKNAYKSSIKDNYITTLTDKFYADIIYDDFNTPDNINDWISNKTFKLINNLFDDVSDKDFILVNALAIDMEWKKKIQPVDVEYQIHFDHINYWMYVSELNNSGYYDLDFNKKKVSSVEVGAVVNRYDIINSLGKDNIINTVKTEYQKWLNEGAPNGCAMDPSMEPDANTYVNKFMQELDDGGYKHISSSTDFKFYDDDNVKIFEKELKEYNNTTLEYVAVMPKKVSLKDFIKDTNAEKLSTIIDSVKPFEIDNFKDGVLTDIKGYIPMFNYEYGLRLMEDLQSLGITDVFDSSKADLSNITSDKAYIASATHKANIEFSNDGIKAAAATTIGGKGAGDCGFFYYFDIPQEKIDITFDNPYLYIIRDKNTKEVWFVGTVYEPKEYEYIY